MSRISKRQQTTTSIFQQRVLSIVKDIPKGSVLTYKEVAIRAGIPGAARAVGTMMKKNTNPRIPCHRVIKSDRTIGEYNKGREEKKKRLQQEGVVIVNNTCL